MLLGLLAAQGARAGSGIADPGFAFVDVNGDGLYSAAEGDIGLASTPSVDINALIQNGGVFNTQVSSGCYSAPAQAASLVIPASQTLFVPRFLLLRAGRHLIVHGKLTAPALFLQAGGNIDLTLSETDFATFFGVCAGGDVTLTGATATGDYPLSHIGVLACGNIVAGTSEGQATAFLAGTGIVLAAARAAHLDGASLLAIAPASAVTVSATDTVQATNGCTLLAGTIVGLSSRRGSVSALDGSLSSDGITLSAARNVSVTDSSLSAGDNITLRAGGQITGNTPATALVANNLYLDALSSADLRGAALLAFAGVLRLRAYTGGIDLTDATLGASEGLSIRARRALHAARAFLRADHAADLTSDAGAIYAPDSTLVPFSPDATDTLLTVTAPGLIAANRARWSVPARITVLSTASNVLMASALLQATGSPGKIAISAMGGLIDATGAAFLGAVSFGPAGVTVLGP
jgi:hypothetical protein